MTDRGFFFANEMEARLNIYTRNNADGTSTKEVVLTDCKKRARVRQSNSRDYNEVARLASNDLQYAIAILSSCTMLDSKRAGLSDIEELTKMDLLRLGSAYCLLNTKDWKTLMDDFRIKVIEEIANIQLE